MKKKSVSAPRARLASTALYHHRAPYPNAPTICSCVCSQRGRDIAVACLTTLCDEHEVEGPSSVVRLASSTALSACAVGGRTRIFRRQHRLSIRAILLVLKTQRAELRERGRAICTRSSAVRRKVGQERGVLFDLFASSVWKVATGLGLCMLVATFFPRRRRLRVQDTALCAHISSRVSVWHLSGACRQASKRGGRCLRQGPLPGPLERAL